ncbi:MAG: hypothetical protein A3E87_04135 [Gammaproteobacteria bacterium RIFCSPHIGHO2_12_FULL_35_23]|nr:MAG: hypothetical protein A3E87_04135 [Gammaproteobacteria bacterium RIFCSPHIGHO2_12_FULL_35_23]
MKITVFSAKPYEIELFIAADYKSFEFQFIADSLDNHTVETVSCGEVVCCFVVDQLDSQVLNKLAQQGVKLIALRSAGYDHIDLKVAKGLGLMVVNVPSYSPQAVAEFSIGMLLALTRKIIQAHDKIEKFNFSLTGQLGFNLAGKTVGLIGTGHIGSVVAKILTGFDCKLLAYDVTPNDFCKSLGVTYVNQETLFRSADIISLHCLLNDSTRYIINSKSLALMKEKVVIINTGRGTLIDTKAIIAALKSGKVGALGIDVYEYERGLFFKDHSSETITDELFLQLQAMSNVLITGHQAYFSQEALGSIIKTTLENILAFQNNILRNQLV